MKDIYKSPEEITDLAQAFESCTLDHGSWTHHAHLTIALWYLIQRPKEEATQLIREGIKRYNEACGVVMTKDSGYHETITLFYIWLVDNFVKGLDDTDSILEMANRLIKERGDKTLPLQYYSRERLMSWEARTGWVEPDLRPLT
jgi:hypothetical protein